MEYEVIIAAFEPKITKFDYQGGSWGGRCEYLFDKYELNQPLTHKPEFLAVRDGCFVEFIVKIDQSKSDFEKGLLIPMDKGNKVTIMVKKGKDKETGHKILYTSFRKLLTHSSTDEFIEETTGPLQLIEQDNRILCNGSVCNHVTYCKYFNYSRFSLTKDDIKSI